MRQIILILLSVFLLSACVTDQSLYEENTQLKADISKLKIDNKRLKRTIELKEKAYDKNIVKSQESIINDENQYYVTNALACHYINHYLSIQLCSDDVYKKSKKSLNTGTQPIIWLSMLYIMLCFAFFALILGVFLGVFYAVASAIFEVFRNIIIKKQLEEKISHLNEKYQEMKKTESEHFEKVSKLDNEAEDLEETITELEFAKIDVSNNLAYAQQDLSIIEEKITELQQELQEMNEQRDMLDF